MSDQLFIVLRVCLLALVYLVFLRVLRAVWVELRVESAEPNPAAPADSAPTRAPRPSPSPAPATAIDMKTARLVVIAPPALAGHTFMVEGETTIGRGAGCAVAIDDLHVSKLHARVFPHEGGLLVEDLGSTNGTMLDGDLLEGPTAIIAGNRITIGEIVLELA